METTAVSRKIQIDGNSDWVDFKNAGNCTGSGMNPRCGNCSYICVKSHKKRVELLEMLKTSGKVYIDDNGKEYVEKINENGEKKVYYPPTQEEYFGNA